MKNVPNPILVVTLLAAAVLSAPAAWSQRPASGRGQEVLERQVRKELVTLPFYGVFDNFAFKVDGYAVTLLGQVTRPTLKTDAEAAVSRIESVEKVINQIEVLPLSPNDDQLRLAVYRAIYGQGALERYAVQAVPPIHIIVRGGNVTLEGVVSNEGDKDIANLRAKGVSGVFSVTNNLRVEQGFLASGDHGRNVLEAESV